MKKKSLISGPVSTNNLYFDDMYEEFSKNWEIKAKQLQERRWRVMKRAMKERINDARY